MIRLEEVDPRRDLLVFEENHVDVVGGVRYGHGAVTAHSHGDFGFHSHPRFIRPYGEMSATAGDEPEGLDLQPYQRTIWSRVKSGLRWVLITPRRPQ